MATTPDTTALQKGAITPAQSEQTSTKKAVNLMEEVIKMAPGEAISLDHLGDIYFALGRKREAYFMWNQANDLAEPNPLTASNQ